MRTYLADFMTACHYEQEDIAFLLNTYDRIMSDDTAKRCFDGAVALYDKTEKCDHERVIRFADSAANYAGVHEYTAEFLVYMCMTRSLHARYRERGLDDEIFYNSMLDLRYKLEECKAVKGVVGTFVAFWYAGFFDMTRFALGRLQFEIIEFGEEYEKDGKRLTPDSKVINVHIPRTGTPIDEASCQNAYERAKSFFADECGRDVAFVCHSWLLYPDMRTILPPQSNMVKFMSRYDIVTWQVDKNKSDLWRLFDTDESNPDRLPTDTAARRCFVEHIKNGGKLGWGYGVFFA